MPALTVNERLLSKTVSHHIGVQRLAAGAVQQVANRLRDNDAEVYDVIRRRSNENGFLAQSHADKLLASVRNINARVYRDIGDELYNQLIQLARYEIEYNQDLVSTILPFDWQLTRPRLKFVRAIVGEEPMHGGLLDEWIDGLAFGRFTRMRQAIRTGISIGETAEQIVKRIRGRRALNYRDGVLDISLRSADKLVSTIYNHVANRAKLTLFDENTDVIQFVVWTAVLDDVTCNQCAALDGEQYSMEDAFVIEESGTGPPLHPNCRCSLSPVIGTLDDFDIDPEEVTSSVRAMMDGRKPNKLTYQQWLEDQDRETQEDILGKERAAIFRRGLPVKKFVDHTGKRLTLPELRRVEAKTLHPKRLQPRTSFMAANNKRRNYGWKPDLPDQRDHLFAVSQPADVALPVKVSLRDKMPPVFTQGDLGSCTAQAIIAAAMFAFGPETPMLSRLDLYYKERVIEDTIKEDSGAEIRNGIKALAQWGVCTEQTWPYKVRSFKQHPPKAAGEEDDKYKIREYQRLKSHEDFMKCLATGHPFVGGFSVYENFDDAVVENIGILPVPLVTEHMVGGHAVLFVGYDSEFHSNPVFKKSGLHESQVPALMYEVRNSFGAGWGDDGHFWMPSPYAEDRDLSDDFWVLYK